MKIYPLSRGTLDAALSMIEQVFPYKPDQRSVRHNLTESLEKVGSGKEYWVAVNQENRVLGITGLYDDRSHQDVVWLGWYGVHREFRNHGIGSMLLQFAIDEATSRGYTQLKLYSSSDSNEKAAHRLYEKFGFTHAGIGKTSDKIYFEKSLKEAFPLVNTRMSMPVVSKRVDRHKKMLESSLTWMAEEFDRYIGENEEVPWLYSERALLGFFISGLIRKGHAVVLQEFSCYKGKGQSKKAKLGRADLYFTLRSIPYLLESKWCYSPLNTSPGMDEAVKLAQKGLKQANQYAKDADVKRANIFSMCFEVIYCTKKKYKDYPGKIEEWKIDKDTDLEGLDYYTLIEVSESLEKKAYAYADELYPALAVYGLFNR